MINIHLNGDMVSCPDIARIHAEAEIIRYKHGICKFNIHEDICNVWQNSPESYEAIKKNSKEVHCCLFCKKICPQYKKRIDTGNMQKSFKIDNVNYRKLSSSAYSLVKTSKFKTLFITLTFPKFKKQVNEKQLNEYFSRYVENLRKNYNASGYVAVRERGDINKRYHYHLLLSIPYIPYSTLNDSWCHTISDICEFSKCAVRTTKKTRFINNPGYALRYVCKYFTKAKGINSKTRVIFISNNLIRKPERFSNTKTEYYRFSDLLVDYKSVRITKTSDYTTLFRITDHKEFDIFTERVLNKLFDLTKQNNDLFCPGTG